MIGSMRIAMINQSYYPMVSGASIVMQRLAEGMVAREHAVLVVAASERGPAYLLETGNLRQVRIASWRNPLRAGQRFNLNSKNAVFKALEEYSPQLVHLHEPLQMGAAGAEYCRRSGIPCLLTLHALPVLVASYAPNLPGLRRTIETLVWFISRSLADQFPCVVTPTQMVADLVSRELHLAARVISNGVDLNAFQTGPLEPAEEAFWRAKLAIPPDVPVILHVGRLDSDKQVDVAIQAAALAMTATPTTRPTRDRTQNPRPTRTSTPDQAQKATPDTTATAVPAPGADDIKAVAPGAVTSQILLYNPGVTGKTRVTITVYDLNGAVVFTENVLVKKGTTRVFALPASLGDGFQGSARIESPKPIRALVLDENARNNGPTQQLDTAAQKVPHAREASFPWVDTLAYANVTFKYDITCDKCRWTSCLRSAKAVRCARTSLVKVDVAIDI
jgi:hypothetical protein